MIAQDKFIEKIARNSRIILTGNVASAGLNIVSFTLVANQLGPELLAILVLAQTYALIINDIFNIQTWESMIKFGSSKMSKEEMGGVIKTNVVLDMISAAVAYLFSLLLLKTVADMFGWNSAYLGVISIYTISILFNITSFTIGIPRLFDKFKTIAKIFVFTALLKLGLIVYASYLSGSLELYVYIYLSMEILTNLSLIAFSLVLIRKELLRGWWRTRVRINMDQLRFIWWSNLRTIIRIPVRHLDVLIIGSVISLQMLGVYKVYKELAGLISRIGDPVNQAIYPQFAQLLGAREIERTSSVAKKTILILGGIGGFIVIALLLTSEFILGTFFGTEYLSHIYALYIMLILYGISFSTVPVNALFIASGFVKLSVNIVLISNSLYLITAYWLGIRIGIYGIIAAYAVQIFLNKGLKIYVLAKYSGKWGAAVQ